MPPILHKEGQISAEIIHIRSDQKVQCLPFQYDNSYICLFAVFFDKFYFNNSLIVYPRSQNNKPFEAFGQFVDAETIETNNIEIFNLMTNTYRNEKFKFDKHYVYFDKIDEKISYFFMIGLQDPNTVIEVLTSTYNFGNNMKLYPNPSSAQIFAIKDKNISLFFDSKKDFLVNIGTVNGLGKFHWKDKNTLNKAIYLNGYGDRTSLTTYTSDENNKLSPLYVESLYNLADSKDGFIFYITYYPRNYMDQLKHDRFSEIHYRNVNMPLNYYAPVTYGTSWIVNLNFYEINQ